MPNLKSYFHLNTLILTIVLSFLSLLSTAAGGEEEAKKLFSEGKYADALPFYEQLYNLYPNDAPIQYALGVCMTETGNFSQKAKKILLQAALNDKTSAKVYFYIGKIYHASNDFETADSYYKRFEENGKKKDFKEVDYKNIQENCLAGINPFVTPPVISEPVNNDLPPAPIEPESNQASIEEVKVEEIIEPVQEEIMPVQEPVVEKTETEEIVPEQITVADEPIEIAKEITPEVMDSTSLINPKVLAEEEQAFIFETQGAPSAQTDTMQVNQEINIESPVEVTEDETEEETPAQTENIDQNFADTLFNFVLTSTIQYHKVEQFRTENGRNEFIKGLKAEAELNETLEKTAKLRNKYSTLQNENKKAKLAQQVLDMELKAPELKASIDKAFTNSRETEIDFWKTASDEEIEKLKSENDSILNAVKASTEKQNIIEQEQEIVQADTIPVAPIDSSVVAPVIDEEINHVVYKIQIGAYSKGLPEYIDKLYKKLSVLRKIDNYTDERGVVVYTVGEVSNFDDALKLQSQIRQEGVKDAFVVAYNNGKRITLKEAKELTQE